MKKCFVFLLAMALFSGLEAKRHADGPCGAGSARVFSSLVQWLLPKEPILLEQVVSCSSEVDLSFASACGAIVFNHSGTYKIVWHGERRVSLYPTWTLGVSLDGTILLGSVYGPREFCTPSETFEGSLVLRINAGQTLYFINASPHPVELVPGKGAIPWLVASFAVSITLFEPICAQCD